MGLFTTSNQSESPLFFNPSYTTFGYSSPAGVRFPYIKHFPRHRNDEPSTPQKRTHLTGYPPRTTSPAGFSATKSGATFIISTRHTVAKWRKRQGTAEASSRPHTIHANLSPAQEQITVALRTNLLLPLDDRLAVTHEFINTSVSRSEVSRCLRRHNVSNLNVLREQLEPSAATAKPKPFKDDDPGFIHVRHQIPS